MKFSMITPKPCSLSAFNRAQSWLCIVYSAYHLAEAPFDKYEYTVAHSLCYTDVSCSRLAKIEQSISDLWTRASASESNKGEL